jgi:hypothetical protein
VAVRACYRWYEDLPEAIIPKSFAAIFDRSIVVPRRVASSGCIVQKSVENVGRAHAFRTGGKLAEGQLFAVSARNRPFPFRPLLLFRTQTGQ